MLKISEEATKPIDNRLQVANLPHVTLVSKVLRRGAAAWVLILGTPGFCAAQEVHAREFEGTRIVSIRFQPPSQPIEPEELNSMLLPMKSGAQFHTRDLRAAIRRLFRTGRYTDIAVEGRPVNGGVELIFRTVSQWFVGTINVAGRLRAPPTRGQLYAAGDLELGRPVASEEIKNAAEQLAGLLRRNGFCEAKVTPLVTRDSLHQQANIDFFVEPGRRADLRPPVITGVPVIDPEEVADATNWRGLFGWRPATESNLNRGLRRVRQHFQQSGRLLARVSLADVDCDARTNQVTPTLAVYGGPKVGIETAGADISKRKLKKYVPIFDVGAVDRDLLSAGASNLRDYLQSRGYFNAEVDYEFKRVGPDKENIVYKITPGERHKLVRVIVEGNRYFTTETIRERMYIQPAGLLRLRHGRYSSGFARRDRESIESLYQSNGFRDVNVSIDVVSYQGKRNRLAAVVRIVEGEQYFVSDLSLKGVEKLDKAEIVASLSSIPGQPFSDTNVAFDRDYIIGLYNDSGFPNATFNWSMRPGPGPHRVSIEYTITEGPRFFVRDVLVTGNRTTSGRLIETNIDVHRNEPLSLQAMTGTQQNLYNLGVFQRVGMAIQNPEGETERKFLLYDLQEADRVRVAIGAGAEVGRLGGGSRNSLNYAAGKAGFSPRVSLDITRLNLWGLAHRGIFVGRASTLEQLGSLNYFWPQIGGDPNRDLTFTALADRAINVNTFTSRRLEASTRLAQKLTRASTVIGSFSFRRVSVSNVKINPLLIPLLAQPVRVGMLSGTYLFDRRDNPIDATRGMFNTLDAGVSSRIFGSERSFSRLFATNSTYHPLRKNLVFARRIAFGWLAPFAVERGIPDDQAIPLPERFYAGGANSHRGFPENQAGPRDLVTGFPIGGNAVLIHNAELRFPLLGDNIGGVLFHDMGNVYSTIQSISFRFHQRGPEDFNYMVHAVGFGIRYRTPVGPFRADFAYSINSPEFFGFKGTTQELLEGTAQRVRQRINRFQFFISIGQAF